MELPTSANSRRAILEALKREGSLSAKDLAKRLKITVAGIRQHLATCQIDDLVATTPVRSGPGRPTLMFSLTSEGQRLFGQRYDRICLEILHHAKSVGGDDLVKKLFAERQKSLVKQYRKAASEPDLRDRLKSLAKIRDDEGYMASVGKGDDCDATLVEHHCPISCVASEYPELCDLELKLIRKTLGSEARVERAEHMIRGDHVCRYKIHFNSKKRKRS